MAASTGNLLESKVILITGAGNGIGKAHAIACAREGARIVVNDLGGSMHGTGSDDSAASLVVKEIEAMGGEAVANFDSVTDAEGCARMVQAAIDTWGKLDGVVNNAGILRDKTFRKMSADEWDAVIDVHLHGTCNVTKAALSALMENGGSIVNTSSFSGLIGNFGQANYAAAKAGVYGFTRVLALELRKYKVTANAIAPVAKTRMTDDIDMVDGDWTPEQISPAVVYLLSDLAKNVTGKILGIQGQRIHAYEMKMNDGVEKEGSELWTAEEIAEKIDAIFEFEAPAAASAGEADVVSDVFAHFPAGFKKGVLPTWTATIHWDVKGGTSQSVQIADDNCTVSAGLQGDASCTVKLSKDTLVAMFKGELDSTKAFMTGKASADNMGDLMKMAQVFDFAAIGEAYAAASGDSGGGTDPVDDAFELVPLAYLPEKAGDFATRLHFVIKGGPDKTLICGDGKATVEDGLQGEADCTLKTNSETIVGMFNRTIDAQKAFMQGKITADNMGVLMKFAMYFDFSKSAAAAPQTAKPVEAPAEDTGPREYPIGKKYDRGFIFAEPEHSVSYASATNDESSAYFGDDAICPPMLHVRLFIGLMMDLATDRDLDLDILRLVHGEHDATFHKPLRPWDLVQLRGELAAVEQKSSGMLVTGKMYGTVEGELAVEVKTSYFIRAKTRSSEKKAATAPAEAPPAPDNEVSFQVADDQSYRYAEVSLDDNPIHTDPNTAKAAGLPDVILHGLCTMALSGKSLVDTYGGGNPNKLRRLSVRFAKPVFNGETLTTQSWTGEDGQVRFQVNNGSGKAVISNGIAEFSA